MDENPSEPRELRSMGELREAADQWASDPRASMPATYLGRIRAMVDNLPPGAFRPTDYPATEVSRRRPTKALIEAWLRIPRPHIQANEYSPLERIVNRAWFLEGEVYERLKGLCFEAEPLELEVHRPREAREILRIKGEQWDGEPTINGDVCLGAFQEVLHVRAEAEDAGQPDPRGGPHRVPQGPATGPRTVAQRGTSLRPAAPGPKSVLDIGR